MYLSGRCFEVGKEWEERIFTSAVNPIEAVGKIIALHDSLEPVEVATIIGDEIVDIDITCPITGYPWVDVPFQASGIVGEKWQTIV